MNARALPRVKNCAEGRGGAAGSRFREEIARTGRAEWWGEGMWLSFIFRRAKDKRETASESFITPWRPAPV